MAEDRSLELFRSYSTMEVGLDRVLLGISLAICGYMGQTVEFGKIGLNVPTGNLLVVLLFVLSAALGVRRLERTRDTAKLNHQVIEFERLRSKVAPHSLQAPEMKQTQESLERRLEKAMNEAASAYNGRNLCMFVGLLAFVALKVVAAYVPAGIS